MWKNINQLTSNTLWGSFSSSRFCISFKWQPHWLRISAEYIKRNGRNSVKTSVENILNTVTITLWGYFIVVRLVDTYSLPFLIQPAFDNVKMIEIRGNTIFHLIFNCKWISASFFLPFFQLRLEILMRHRAGSTSSTINTCLTRMPSETRSPSAIETTCELQEFTFHDNENHNQCSQALSWADHDEADKDNSDAPMKKTTQSVM